jgi:hypothetical protein
VFCAILSIGYVSANLRPRIIDTTVVGPAAHNLKHNPRSHLTYNLSYANGSDNRTALRLFETASGTITLPLPANRPSAYLSDQNLIVTTVEQCRRSMGKYEKQRLSHISGRGIP